MTKRFKFDTRAAIVAAWDALWAERLKARKKEEAADRKIGRGPSRWTARTYYVTAADVEERVRSYAADTVAGEPWGAGTYPHRIRLSGNLTSAVRDFLLRGNGGKIVGHNFGRGHISGMRFRPAGEPMAPTELKTIAKKEERRANPRPQPRHFGRSYGSSPLCVVESRKKNGRQIYGWRQSKARTTTQREDITCPRCAKLLASMPIEVTVPVCDEVA